MELSLTDLIAIPQLVPFSLALGVIVLVLFIELIGIFLGFSSLNDADGDVDFDADVDLDFDVDVDVDLDLDIAFGEVDVPEIDLALDADGSVWSFLEFGRVPLLIWILSMASSLAMAGYGIQLLLNAVLGFMLPALIALPVALIPAVMIGRVFVVAFALMVPKASTQAINIKSLGGSTGHVSMGVAETDRPAEARVKDRHGNTHSVRVVPFKGEPALPSGTEIVVLRGQEEGVFQALSLQSAKERYTKS